MCPLWTEDLSPGADGSVCAGTVGSQYGRPRPAVWATPSRLLLGVRSSLCQVSELTKKPNSTLDPNLHFMIRKY